jgi:hypothetical protein
MYGYARKLRNRAKLGVAGAVRAKLDEAQRAREARKAERLRRISEMQEEIARLPVIGPLLTDAELYDEDGLPR